jgi:hypothetical protein
MGFPESARTDPPRPQRPRWTTFAFLRVPGGNSLLASAIGSDWKGKLSPIRNAAAIALSVVNPWIARGLYVLVALVWLIPDRRIERVPATDGNDD